MPKIWLPDNGVNRQVKKISFADPSGVQRKAKSVWVNTGDGVNRKIFSAFASMSLSVPQQNGTTVTIGTDAITMTVPPYFDYNTYQMAEAKFLVNFSESIVLNNIPISVAVDLKFGSATYGQIGGKIVGGFRISQSNISQYSEYNGGSFSGTLSNYLNSNGLAVSNIYVALNNPAAPTAYATIKRGGLYINNILVY